MSLIYCHLRQFTSHRIQTHGHRPEPSSTLSLLLLSLWGLRFLLQPSCLHCFKQPLQASFSPHINYSLYPLVPAPPPVTQGVTKSGRSEVILPTATPGISQKFVSLCLKPCGPSWWHPRGPQAAVGRQRSPIMSQHCPVHSVWSSTRDNWSDNIHMQVW